MLVFEKNKLSEDIESFVEKYGSDRSALLPVLQSVQRKYHHISDFAQQEIARLMNIHPVEVHSVISFYTFLHEEPQGKNIVRLCKTISCDLAGKSEVEKAVQRELGIRFGETTKDQKVTLEHTDCLGMCDQGPAMLVNEKVFTNLDPENAVKILNEIR